MKASAEVLRGIRAHKTDARMKEVLLSAAAALERPSRLVFRPVQGRAERSVRA